MRTRPTWSLATSVATVLLGAAAFSGCSGSGCERRATTSTASASPPLFVESCEDAKKHPEAVSEHDVRFVECDRKPVGKGEAFSLGPPLLDPVPGPKPGEGLWYAPGHCAHGGGAITEHNILYKPEHLEAAITCSRHRCDSNDALGCRDLGALHRGSRTLMHLATKTDEPQALAAFTRACRLGDGPSCAILADTHEGRGDPSEAAKFEVAACEAKVPSIISCWAAGRRLLEMRRPSEAKVFLLRSCRGTTDVGLPFRADRFGCGLLAEMAKQRGDLESYREYLRLECAYGGAALPACEELGLFLFAKGDTKHALPYLRKACNGLVESPRLFARGCVTLARLTGAQGQRKEAP